MNKNFEMGGNLYNKYESKTDPEKILEVGCGEGYIIRHIKKKYPKSYFEGLIYHGKF